MRFRWLVVIETTGFGLYLWPSRVTGRFSGPRCTWRQASQVAEFAIFVREMNL